MRSPNPRIASTLPSAWVHLVPFPSSPRIHYPIFIPLYSVPIYLSVLYSYPNMYSLLLSHLLRTSCFTSCVTSCFTSSLSPISGMFKDSNWRVRKGLALAMPALVKSISAEYFVEHFLTEFLLLLKDGVDEVRTGCTEALPRLIEPGQTAVSAAWFFEKVNSWWCHQQYSCYFLLGVCTCVCVYLFVYMHACLHGRVRWREENMFGKGSICKNAGQGWDDACKN